MTANLKDCYHCGEVIPARREVIRHIDGKQMSLCCEGCAAVAAVIHESGLYAYYKKRTARPRPVDKSRNSLPQAFSEIFDDDSLCAQLIESDDETSTAHFIVQNMHCPTCVWLIERRLGALPGIQEANVNFRTQKLSLRWKLEQLRLSEIVDCVQGLGYSVVPFGRNAFSETIRTQNHDLLKRLGVAGVFGMQVMVIAVALYASAWSSIEIAYEELFRRLSLLLALPIILYSAAPIFAGAVRDLKHKSATMDVPVALGLLIAFIASLSATVQSAGEIYYDSIAMFVFLQLSARYLEHGAYRRMTDRISALTAATPSYANRMSDSESIDSVEVVPALRLQVGDFVLTKPGEAFPADGTIITGRTDVNESILTGESDIIKRDVGDAVFGGSVNVTDAVVIEVTNRSDESALAAIVRLLERSNANKPRGRRLTDMIASKFAVAVVLIATVVGGFWFWLGSPAWLAHTIAVLVVACPCALSLAVPTALTATINSAAKHGILLARAEAVIALANADTFLFDKTGTLTENRARLASIELFGACSEDDALRIAAALAQHSDHPIAKALTSAQAESIAMAQEVRNIHGGGIIGDVDGSTYRLGSSDFIESKISGPSPRLTSVHTGLVTYLNRGEHTIARFHFDNLLRADAKELIAWLNRSRVHLAVVTGDRKSEADRVGAELGISEVHWQCSPVNKLDIISERQKSGRCVAMVGDGVNDAPTLATADVSIAPASAQHIAKVNADVIILEDQLNLVAVARDIAQFSAKIMRSNTVWAIAYNMVGVSLAAAGFVPPLAAAVGMSASSLLVVGNSLRIMSYRPNLE